MIGAESNFLYFKKVCGGKEEAKREKEEHGRVARPASKKGKGRECNVKKGHDNDTRVVCNDSYQVGRQTSRKLRGSPGHLKLLPIPKTVFAGKRGPKRLE